jgi:hypothetical protein
MSAKGFAGDHYAFARTIYWGDPPQTITFAQERNLPSAWHGVDRITLGDRVIYSRAEWDEAGKAAQDFIGAKW